MIHPQRLAQAAIVVLVLCSAYAHAQTPAQTTEASKELREKAFNLLESAAGQVNALQSAENRARIAANIMDSLWTHDEKRARSLLTMIESDIREGVNREDPQFTRSHTFQVFLKLRADTIERIAKYDPELALTFLKSTEVTTIQPLLNDIAESDREIELRLAKKIAANKPELALKIARESLARGLSDDLLAVLRQLNRKHKDDARTLYKEIVSKVREVKFEEHHWQNRNFVQRLALSFSPPDVDANTFRELLSFLITKALDGGCRKSDTDYVVANFCSWIVSSLPRSYKSDSRVAELSHWASEEHDRNPSYFELDAIGLDATVDEVLALRDKYPLDANVSWRAFELANASGDQAKAREVANSSTNPEVRQMMLEYLDGAEKNKTSNEQLLADLQRRLNDQPRTEGRLAILLSVADAVAATDRNTALKLLNQASDLIDTLQPGWQQTAYQMGLAMMYCQSKSDRCFQIMEPLVPRFNQLVDSALKLDGFDTQYLRDGEWNMSANGRIGELLTGLAQNAGQFAWCDFDRAVSLSHQFERTEIRLMAQVKLAQSILAGPQKSLLDQRYRR
jgi:hypothetical protein